MTKLEITSGGERIIIELEKDPVHISDFMDMFDRALGALGFSRETIREEHEAIGAGE